MCGGVSVVRVCGCEGVCVCGVCVCGVCVCGVCERVCVFGVCVWLSSTACGILVPLPGMGPGPVGWKRGVLTAGPPGKSLSVL